MARRNLLLVGLFGAAAVTGALHYQREARAGDYAANALMLLRATPGADRIWAHRVNSIEALREAKEIFAGVEVDLVFDRTMHSFRVWHPPQDDIGLSLDEYLAASADRPNLRLWFDWKNPTPGNLAEGLAELARLDGKYRIRGRALVETPSDAAFAGIEAVSRRGFLHGYYLPTERALAAAKGGAREVASLGAEVRATVERGRYGAVTYDARLQPFVDQQLDAFLRQRELRRFSWDQRIDSGDPDTDPASLGRTAGARGLDALLVTFPSRFRI